MKANGVSNNNPQEAAHEYVKLMRKLRQKAAKLRKRLDGSTLPVPHLRECKADVATMATCTELSEVCLPRNATILWCIT